jgi:hypothetical protein
MGTCRAKSAGRHAAQKSPLFQRNVETNILAHGCSPFDAWARLPVVSPYFHPIGEQPPPLIVNRKSGPIAPDYPCGRVRWTRSVRSAPGAELGSDAEQDIWRRTGMRWICSADHCERSEREQFYGSG